ncbi:MAG TPA: GNAT family N-acetyltransferase [Pyrinomonadaceae bacterium]|nr:GNAT family N-acetyltransferase [Pyrinomonadaceae bacterium]
MNDHNQTVNASSAITLRPVVAADEPLLLELYASTRAAEMAMVPWTREQQEAFVRMQFDAQLAHYKKIQPDANHDIIMSNGRPVGRLYVARTKEHIEIMDITVLPQERNGGIGSSLIRDLMKEAESSRPLRIYVENFNPSLRLFERLGFKAVEEDGFMLLMAWVPNRPPPSQ